MKTKLSLESMYTLPACFLASQLKSPTIASSHFHIFSSQLTLIFQLSDIVSSSFFFSQTVLLPFRTNVLTAACKPVNTVVRLYQLSTQLHFQTSFENKKHIKKKKQRKNLCKNARTLRNRYPDTAPHTWYLGIHRLLSATDSSCLAIAEVNALNTLI